MKNWKFKNFIIHQFAELDSTNVKAFNMAESQRIFDREIILADCQSAGRGRMGRVWSSPKGNLYFSLVLQPRIPIFQMAQISFVSIVALRQAVEELASVSKKSFLNIQNKWPNDLIINEKKVAGLLLESKINQQDCEFVILGIGVNIDSSPDNAIFSASNLKEFKIETKAEILLQIFLDKFEILYQNWQDFGFANVRNAWLSKAYKLKEKILVMDGDNKIEGIFEDLDSEGSLILLVNGARKKINAADIFNVKK